MSFPENTIVRSVWDNRKLMTYDSRVKLPKKKALAEKEIAGRKELLFELSSLNTTVIAQQILFRLEKIHSIPTCAEYYCR